MSNFFELNEYVIDEKVRPFKMENAYLIHDINGELVGAVEQHISGGGKAARVLFGRTAKTFQKFNLNILDAEGNVLITMDREGRIGMKGYTVLIKDPSGNVLGKVAPKLSFKSVIFHIYDASENVVGILNGKLLGINYTIQNPDETQIGTINKDFSNVAREIFTSADKYRVSLTGSVEKEKKLLITAAAVAIDMLLHEIR